MFIAVAMGVQSVQGLATLQPCVVYYLSLSWHMTKSDLIFEFSQKVRTFLLPKQPRLLCNFIHKFQSEYNFIFSHRDDIFLSLYAGYIYSRLSKKLLWNFYFFVESFVCFKTNCINIVFIKNKIDMDSLVPTFILSI